MSIDEPLPFPLGHGSVTVTTRRERDVHIRHITAEDAALLIDLFGQLSRETRRLRFFAPKPDMPDEVLWPQAMRLSPRHRATGGSVLPGERRQSAFRLASSLKS